MLIFKANDLGLNKQQILEFTMIYNDLIQFSVHLHK